jgi:signal transduction histidine kinase
MKSLKARFFAITVVTLVTPAFLTMILSYLGTRRMMSTMIEKNARDDLQGWCNETETLRREHTDALIALFGATHHYVHQFRAFENEQQLFERHLEDKLADFLCARSTVYAQALWVANGRPKIKFVLSPIYFMTTGRPLKVEKQAFDGIDKNLAKVAVDSPNTEIGFGPLQITNNGLATTLGIPLRESFIQKSPTGWSDNCPEQFGMIFFELRLDFLFSEAASRTAGQIFTDAIPMVFDSGGTIIYHPQPEFRCQKIPVRFPALAAHFQSSKSAVISQPVHFEHDGRRWVMLSQPSDGQWYFALLLEEEKFIQRLQPLYRINLAIMLVGVVVAAALLGIAFRQLGQRIGALAAGAHAIAKGNLDHRVVVNSTDELGVLGRAFNRMAESLKGLIREQAEKERLKALNDVKDAFISNVSHELKGPLSRIELGVENLRRGVAGAINEKQCVYFSRIQENIRRLIRMIDELLDVSRIESGRVELEVSPCSVNEILTEVIEEARPQWQSKTMQVSNACPDQSLHLLADRDKLKQIISNLLDNAIKFTGENGEISLRAERQNGHIELAVADTGIGIAPEHLGHLFERFYQAHAPVPGSNGIGKNGGLGLGLNIVKSLVELHGGDVAVESEVGAGTRVIVKFPAECAEGEGQRA